MKDFFTWGDLRTWNAENLQNKMIALGKGKRVHFKMGVSATQEWVIVPKEEYDQMLFDQARIKNLESRLKTIVTVAEL